MKSQMLFIEPTAAQVHIFSQFTLPRLGSFILAGLVPHRSAWNARVFIEGSRHFDLNAWIADLDALPIPDFSLARRDRRLRDGWQENRRGADLPRLPI
jgi:hypothetical protein